MRKLTRLMTVITAAAAFAPLAANAMTAPIMGQSAPSSVRQIASAAQPNGFTGGRPVYHRQLDAIRNTGSAD